MAANAASKMIPLVAHRREFYIQKDLAPFSSRCLKNPFCRA
jgi:hypothetical protein